MNIRLPASVWGLIFQYDNTYHEKYRDVVENFKTLISWKVVWVHSDRKTEYGLSEDWAETISTYWNKTYARYYGYGSENPQQCCMELEIFPKAH